PAAGRAGARRRRSLAERSARSARRDGEAGAIGRLRLHRLAPRHARGGEPARASRPCPRQRARQGGSRAGDTGRLGRLLDALILRHWPLTALGHMGTVGAVAPLQKLSEEATLVYVLRSSSLLPLLFFNWTFSKLALPLARAA